MPVVWQVHFAVALKALMALEAFACRQTCSGLAQSAVGLGACEMWMQAGFGNHHLTARFGS